MNKKEGNKKECLNCKKKIDLTFEKYVLVGTYEDDYTLDESYFHFQCWQDYFRNCVGKKVMSMTKDVAKNLKLVMDR